MNTLDLDCPICLSTLTSSSISVTDCNHTFHTKCLIKSVCHLGVACPICREPMADMRPNYCPPRLLEYHPLQLLDPSFNRPPVIPEGYVFSSLSEGIVDYVSNGLKSAFILYEDLVKCLLTAFEEYDVFSSEFRELDGFMFNTIRQIIQDQTFLPGRHNISSIHTFEEQHQLLAPSVLTICDYLFQKYSFEQLVKSLLSGHDDYDLPEMNHADLEINLDFDLFADEYRIIHDFKETETLIFNDIRQFINDSLVVNGPSILPSVLDFNDTADHY